MVSFPGPLRFKVPAEGLHVLVEAMNTLSGVKVATVNDDGLLAIATGTQQRIARTHDWVSLDDGTWSVHG